MAAPQQGQQQGGGDNSLAALWLALFFFALCGVIWYVFHSYIISFFISLKYAEIALVNIFMAKTIPLSIQIHHLQKANIDINTLGTILTRIGEYFRYPLMVILALLAVILFLTHPTLRFKKIHSMKSLYEQEKYNWPQIMPVSTIDLVKEPIEKGPWAMSLTPLQFAKKNNLLIEEQKTAKFGENRDSVNISLARAPAYQIFSLQLGVNFYTVERLKPYEKALFAVFAARANREGPVAKKILDQLAVSSATGHLDFSGVNDAVKKYQDLPIIQAVLGRHAYVITMMASMLETGRQDGVLASGDFLWLKIIDRPLWYMLNNVGRQTAFVEVGGAIAHWLAEKKIGRKISSPMVEEAVKALEIALKEVIYVPETKAGKP